MRILLIDDHALFAKSLEIALEGAPEIERLWTLADVKRAAWEIRENRPDLVLVDVNLSNISDEDGLMLAKRIVQDIPGTAVVILTGYDLPVYRFEAQKIGAKGFINKNIEPDKLLTILQQIHVGHSYFPSSGDGIEYIEELTDSERSILQWLSDGYKRKEIADRLHISERTVSNHLQHIFNKLDVTSSLEAVSKGTKLGYVKPGYK